MSSLSKLEDAYFAGTKPSQEELLGFRKLFSKYENAGLSDDQLVTLAQNARSINLDLGAELGQDYYTDKLAKQITNQRKNLGTEKYYQGDLGAIGGIDAATQYMASRLVLSGIRDISEIGEKTQKQLGPDYSNIPQAVSDFSNWYKSGGWQGQEAGSVVTYNGKKYYYTNALTGTGFNFEGSGENYYEPALIPINPIGEQEKVLYNKRTGEQLKQGHDVGYAYANTSISPDNPNARYTIGGTFAGGNTGLNVSMVNGIPMFYTSPGPSSSFISKESIGPVLAIASMMVPGLGVAIGSTITGALGVTVSSAVAGAIGTGVLTTIASGGDVKKGAIAAATSYFVPQIAGEIGDAANQIFESPAGKKLVENVSAAALRTAALGGDSAQIENAVLGATAGGLFDVVTQNLPGFNEITDPKTRAAVVASVQSALDAPGDLANKFQAAALSGATTLGLSQIEIDGKKFSDLSPGQQSIVTTALGRELAGKPLTSEDIFKTVIDAVSKEVRADIQKERAQPEKKAEAEVAPEDLSIPVSGSDLSGVGEPGVESEAPSDAFRDLFGGTTEPPFGGLFAGPGVDLFGKPITGGFGELDLTEDIEIPPELVADLYGPTRPVLPELGEEDLTDEDTADILDIIRDSVEAISPKVVSPDIIPGGESLSPISPTIPGLGVEEFFGTRPSTEPFPYTPGEDADEFEPGAGTVVDTLIGGLANDLLGGETDEEREAREAREAEEIIYGGTGNDTTAGGAETVEGGSGNDTVKSVEGEDTVAGGAGNDTVEAIEGEDTLIGGVGNDTVTAGADTETLTGGAGNDAVFIGTDTETVSGGEGNDVVITDPDGSTITLGPDGEVKQITDVDNNVVYDSSTDQETPEGGAKSDFDVDTDAGSLGVGTDAEGIDVGAEGEDTGVGAGGETTATGGDATDLLFGVDATDTLFGGDQNDTLIGGDETDIVLDDGDTIIGGDENDTLTGENADDTLIGGDENDTLIGGDENDSLVSGDVDDLLTAGDENDTLFGGDENDSLIGGDANDLFVEDELDELDEQTLLDLIKDDTLFGGDADDTLLGGDENDSLVGGDANDTLGGGEDTQPGFGFEVEGDQTGRGAYTYVDDDGNVLIIEEDGTMYLTDPDGNQIDLGNISTKFPLLKPTTPPVVKPEPVQPQPRPVRPPPKKPQLQGLPAGLNWQQFLAQQAALGPMFQPFIAGAQQPSSQAGAGGPRFEAFYANIPGYKPFDVRQFSSDFYDEE